MPEWVVPIIRLGNESTVRPILCWFGPRPPSCATLNTKSCPLRARGPPGLEATNAQAADTRYVLAHRLAMHPTRGRNGQLLCRSLRSDGRRHKGVKFDKWHILALSDKLPKEPKAPQYSVPQGTRPFSRRFSTRTVRRGLRTSAHKNLPLHLD